MKMKSIMRLVVSNKYGTAKQAEALGYSVGGKTGTAEKVSKSGGYLKKQNIIKKFQKIWIPFCRGSLEATFYY